jgi:hypothetical protein
VHSSVILKANLREQMDDDDHNVDGINPRHSPPARHDPESEIKSQPGTNTNQRFFHSINIKTYNLHPAFELFLSSTA